MEWNVLCRQGFSFKMALLRGGVVDWTGHDIGQWMFHRIAIGWE